jgi:undecaprenyl-diphosphatase
LDFVALAKAALLGVVEGLTEFIPVSSTGHLLLAGHFIGFDAPPGFEFMIQLGAILAVVVIYFQRLWSVVLRAPNDPAARHFILSVLLAFLPAAAFGVLLSDWVETHLFGKPGLIAASLIIGGVILIAIDRVAFKVRFDDAMKFPAWVSGAIGLFQCLSLIPGVSRSGSTIVGSLMMGVSKRAATEFSFFLAIPIMVGAFTFDLVKNYDVLDSSGFLTIAVGFVVSFIVALWVVRHLLDFVANRGLAIFGWWRIAVGILVLTALNYG